MTETFDVLSTAPAQPRYDLEALANAVDACFACARTCNACADACLREDDVASLARCIRLDQQCADICDAAARVLSRPSGLDKAVQALLEACIEAADCCAEECERHAEMHEHCRLCADACRRCAEACESLLGTATVAG